LVIAGGQVIERSGRQKSALLAKRGAQSAPLTQFSAYRSLSFFALLFLRGGEQEQ
jgi:hypothetical protein